MGHNRGKCSAQKLLEMIINQSVAILVFDSDHFAEKCFTSVSQYKCRDIFQCVGYLVGDIFPPELDSKSQVGLHVEMLVSARHLTAYLAGPINNY